MPSTKRTTTFHLLKHGPHFIDGRFKGTHGSPSDIKVLNQVENLAILSRLVQELERRVLEKSQRKRQDVGEYVRSV